MIFAQTRLTTANASMSDLLVLYKSNARIIIEVPYIARAQNLIVQQVNTAVNNEVYHP